MNNNKVFGPLLGIAIVTVAGGAFAAGGEPVASGYATGTPSTIIAAAPMKPNAVQPGDTAMRHMLPPQAVIGKDVTNAMGETIGKVTKIAGEQVIVAVGGFLGVGAYDVALNWNQFTASGDGNDIKLQTVLSKDQLKKMPEYKG